MKQFFYSLTGVILITNLIFTKPVRCSYNTRDLEKEKIEYYTIQVASYPMSDSVTAKDHFISMKKQGYLVFLFETYLEKKKWLRIRIGNYHSYSEAEKYGETIKQKLNSEYFIDKNEFVVVTHDSINLIQAPSGIWLIQGSNYREIFDLTPSIFSRYSGAYYTYPFISPSGEDVLFEYDGKIIEVNLKTFQKRIVQDKGVGNSLPQKSPSGKYIAYIDNNLWESPSNLWLITGDTSRQCLVSTKNLNKSAVKFFKWHPDKDIIFFIAGYAYGTVTVGGDFYSVDMNGTIKKLISSNKEKREEIVSQFNIKNNTLYYKIAHFDESYSEIEYTDHNILLTKLLTDR